MTVQIGKEEWVCLPIFCVQCRVDSRCVGSMHCQSRWLPLQMHAVKLPLHSLYSCRSSVACSVSRIARLCPPLTSSCPRLSTSLYPWVAFASHRQWKKGNKNGKVSPAQTLLGGSKQAHPFFPLSAELASTRVRGETLAWNVILIREIFSNFPDKAFSTRTAIHFQLLLRRPPAVSTPTSWVMLRKETTETANV